VGATPGFGTALRARLDVRGYVTQQIDCAQNPAPPESGPFVSGAAVGLDGEVVAVGASLLPVLLLDPHPAAPTAIVATQAIAAMR
jgi:hypothetical protein